MQAFNAAICNCEGVLRNSSAALVDVSDFVNQTAEVWLSFTTADGKEAADNVYLSSLDISL